MKLSSGNYSCWQILFYTVPDGFENQSENMAKVTDGKPRAKSLESVIEKRPDIIVKQLHMHVNSRGQFYWSTTTDVVK